MNDQRIYRKELVMSNATGADYIRNAPGFRFLNIINPTDNAIEVYQDIRLPSQSNVADMLIKIPAFTQLSIPIDNRPDFTFIWTGTPGLKKALIILTDATLGLTGTVGAPITEGSVTIAVDAVGLAKASQLPSQLSGNG